MVTGYGTEASGCGGVSVGSAASGIGGVGAVSGINYAVGMGAGDDTYCVAVDAGRDSFVPKTNSSIAPPSGYHFFVLMLRLP